MIVCLDTNIVIYLIEHNPVWTPRVAARLGILLAAGDVLAVCDAARLECLVKPLIVGNQDSGPTAIAPETLSNYP